MSTGKTDNKPAKKPKKSRGAVPPPAPAPATQGALAVASLNRKKKW